mmetsp:Transcript_37538/g.109955  ORF Transcript_37538/g.109955 Transcript_37538/m.109955 type:complete len:185 (+) Transcript_37538:401-955(+)
MLLPSCGSSGPWCCGAPSSRSTWCMGSVSVGNVCSGSSTYSAALDSSSTCTPPPRPEVTSRDVTGDASTWHQYDSCGGSTFRCSITADGTRPSTAAAPGGSGAGGAGAAEGGEAEDEEQNLTDTIPKLYSSRMYKDYLKSQRHTRMPHYLTRVEDSPKQLSSRRGNIPLLDSPTADGGGEAVSP